jgi:hypothetical protein
VHRLYVTRAALAGLAATLAGGVVLRLTAPALADIAGAEIVLTGGLLAAFGFAVLWDVIPPRSRPVSKAFVYTALIFALFRLPFAAAPAMAIFAVALGIAYRPHAAPTVPPAPPLRPDPRAG